MRPSISLTSLFVLHHRLRLTSEPFGEQEVQKEYFSKLSITLEELDESLFWLETLVFTEIVPAYRLADLTDEGYQILKILSKSRKTASD